IKKILIDNARLAKAAGVADEGRALDLGFVKPRPDKPGHESELAMEHFRRGWSRYWSGRHRDALDLYDQALQAQPSLAVAHYGRACAALDVGSLELGPRELHAALALERARPVPDWPDLMERFQGSNRQLIELLRRANAAGKPLPPLEEVLQQWQRWADSP